MIKFENVSIKYVKDYFALLNFNVEINDNTLFVGDHYVGSTAITRLLSKIDTKYEGEIFIEKQNLKNIKDKNLNLAYVPQIPYLFNSTIEKNLIYPLKIRKINKNIIKNTINSIILKYNLNNFNKKIKNLNLSEKKIIALIRAIIRKPKYLILEHFFEDLDNSYFDLANKIIDDSKEFSTIITVETKPNKAFENFNIVELYKD